jgi:RNA polymerase sigma-70 factor, ECF subfamily
MEGMGEASALADDPGQALLDLYEVALPRVFGYLLTRGGSTALAQDLTSETFLAAVDAVQRENPPPLSTAWLIGVARHKLVDHWRRREREERLVRVATAAGQAVEDPWEARLDATRAQTALKQLSADHRAALTLRYIDDLGVPEVAAIMDRSVHATEGLLVRARGAFRRAYGPSESEEEGVVDV